MEHSKQDLDRLIDKYLSDEATADERNMLEQSYMKASFKTPMNDVSDDDAARIHKIGTDSWEILIEKINYMGTRRSVLWPRIVAIAAAIAMVVFGVYLFTNDKVRNANDILITNDINPGTNKATLILANGKRIFLNDQAKGKLANESGVEITKTADGQIVYQVKDDYTSDSGNPAKMNTIQTPKGGQYQIKLPDGTHVWLNSASVLKYPVSFGASKERRIELTGEAYFEVKKDIRHPFIVKSSQQEVTVLGTHFNINCYAEETTAKTTLLEGSVKVNNLLLKPGEQATIGAGKALVNSVNAEKALAWKNNRFVFENDDIKQVMRTLQRWYDFEVVYEEGITTEPFWGIVSRNDRLSEVLKYLELAGNVHFKIEGRRVLVTK